VRVGEAVRGIVPLFIKCVLCIIYSGNQLQQNDKAKAASIHIAHTPGMPTRARI